MSTTSTTDVACPECFVQQKILVVESANIQRFPQFRQQVLDCTFMRFTCTSCSASFVVEMDMLYTDLDQHLFIGVFPRPRRAQAAECETLIDRTYDQVFVREAPAFARAAVGTLERRVVFGYEELREKVVCFGAGLDDHIVEAMKVSMLDTQPTLGRLSLQHCDDENLWFARIGVAEAPFAVDRATYEKMFGDREKIQLMLPPLWGGTYVSAEKCLAV